MTHAILGYGQVGKAIHKIVGRAHIHDEKVSTWDETPVDVLHVCIPYSSFFDGEVEYYKELAKMTIVHSTVPLGTCERLKVIHSPIRGVHPNLAKGIRTFVKYFGGKGAREAAKVFKDMGIKVKVLKDSRTSEALKLWDTTAYGIMIMLEKEMHEWCEKHKVNFDEVYEEATKTYNEGYNKLGRSEVVRPVLKHRKGKIGGHCVIPNAQLLKDSWLAQTLVKRNKHW